MTETSQRNGDEITLTSAEFVFTLEKNAADVLQANYARLVIFQWHPNDLNIAPTNTQLFLNDVSAGGITWRSFYIKDNKKQFTVLYDRMIRLSGLLVSTDITDNSSIAIKKRINLRKARKTISFNGVGTTTGSDHLYYTILGTSATNGPAYQFGSRINYTDS